MRSLATSNPNLPFVLQRVGVLEEIEFWENSCDNFNQKGTQHILEFYSTYNFYTESPRFRSSQRGTDPQIGVLTQRSPLKPRAPACVRVLTPSAALSHLCAVL
jgi:hypothetical protein